MIKIFSTSSPWLDTNNKSSMDMSGIKTIYILFVFSLIFIFYCCILQDSDSGFIYDSNGAKKLVHHNISKENTSKSMIRLLNPSQFKWMLGGASWITETQTYYLIGDDGSFCLLQMGYSNLT